MEKENNNNNKVTKDEFNELKGAVTELKIALIGIDGKNGFRGTLNSLDKRMGEMEKTVEKISTIMETFKTRDVVLHETFATKLELISLKETIVDEINKLSKEQTESRKTEKERDEDIRIESEKLDLKKRDLVFVKIAIVLSIVGIGVTSILTIINLFFNGC